MDRSDHPLVTLLYSAGFSMPEIGRIFGVSRQRIDQVIPRSLRRGHVSRKPPYSGLADRDHAVLSLAEVLDDWSLTRITFALYGPMRPPRANGRIISRRARVGPAIVNAWNGGMTLRETADALGVSVNHVGSTLSLARATGKFVRRVRM